MSYVYRKRFVTKLKTEITCTYPGVRVVIPSACYRKHEKVKKRAYEQRILEIEHSSFTPLVMSSTGDLGVAATSTYKRLATLLATKMGPALQLYDELAEVSPIILPPAFINSGHQRCSLLRRRGHEICPTPSRSGDPGVTDGHTTLNTLF